MSVTTLIIALFVIVLLIFLALGETVAVSQVAMFEDEYPRCRSCGAPIIWAITESGKRMPVDAAPAPGGTILLRYLTLPPVAHVTSPEERVGMSLHKSHFATCPNADKHRKLREISEDRVGAYHHPDKDAPETEREAALSEMPHTGTHRLAVLRAIIDAGDHGLTDYEGSVVTGIYLYTYAPRRVELRDGGWVEDSGARRNVPHSNKAAAVWRLSEQAGLWLEPVKSVNA